MIIQKELKETDPKGTDDFIREVDVLSFLNCLKHPNIVELLGSYTFKSHHYLLFPPAAGDLSQLLSGEEVPNPLKSEYKTLLALSGLASAIEKLHNYELDALHVSLLGCHRDLKPKNVLVAEGRLLLADFGLSKLKSRSKDSKSPFERGEGYYLAPECEDSEDGFKPLLISRPSDIWSLGCIFAEVATYILLGAEGVQQFKKARKVRLGDVLTTYTFHCGPKPNVGVHEWLEKLDNIAPPFTQGLLTLVKDLLQLEPAKRPSATTVTSRLRQLALSSRFKHVSSLYQKFSDKLGSLELLVELKRFELWGWATGLMVVDFVQSAGLEAIRTDGTMSDCIHTLKKIEAGLQVKSQLPTFPHTSALKLRMLNDDLHEKLPSSTKLIVERRLELQMIETEDPSLLHEIEQTFDRSSRYRSIGILAAIRYMHKLCSIPHNDVSDALRLDDITLQKQASLQNFEISRVTEKGKAWQDSALVERIVYEENWREETGKKLYNRVGAIVRFLRSARGLTHLSVLECIGYYHEQKNHNFVLLFNAAQFDEVGARFVTLRNLIEDTWRHNHRPSLEDRLHLVQRLAAAVLEIHKLGWLHKNISAHNVLLIFNNGAPYDRVLECPRLLGFNHSRPDGPDSISNLPNTKTDELDYRHPDYLEDDGRFRPEYDLFSLGMVLLEAGLWMPLNKMTKRKGDLPPWGPRELVKHLLQKHVPLLDFFVGRKYRAVVETCLQERPPPLTSKASDDAKPTTPNDLVLPGNAKFFADLWA